jgi:hypothetical protein
MYSRACRRRKILRHIHEAGDYITEELRPEVILVSFAASEKRPNRRKGQKGVKSTL